MSAPLSNELFFTAHRGLRNAVDADKGLGSHWTAKKLTAELFAEQVPGGVKKKKNEVSYSRGYLPHTVVTARIPMSSVETNTSILQKKDVVNKEGFHEWPGEHEIPVKEGAPVYVEQIEHISPKRKLPRDKENPNRFQRTRIRTKRFNPPKEVKA